MLTAAGEQNKQRKCEVQLLIRSIILVINAVV